MHWIPSILSMLFFFFFKNPPPPDIYPLPLPAALPICPVRLGLQVARDDVLQRQRDELEHDVDEDRERNRHGHAHPTAPPGGAREQVREREREERIDRKSTRLNSSHLVISYAVFCLKKK